MRVSELDYELPKELIAKYPTARRTDARLMHMERLSGKRNDCIFSDLPRFFKSGDVLVLNNSKVIPSRLFGVRPSGGKVEALLLRQLDSRRWKSLLKPGGRVKKGTTVSFGENGSLIRAKVLNDSTDEAERLIEFENELTYEMLDKIGHIPIPPYLERKDEESDRENYQTVYAKNPGSVASPTAGLHFDEPLLEHLKKSGVEIVYVTLHVGLGTFQPVDAEDIENHLMHEEGYEISDAAAMRINLAQKENRRVIACGTTSVRVLESSAGKDGIIQPGPGKTKLLIYPPYAFKVISGLITNFHLPKTTLLFLVAAFTGRENLLAAYQEAIEKRYRFFSYGDAMILL